MHARLLHPEYTIFFYVDRDELLYCPPDSKSSSDTLNDQAMRQQNIIDHYVTNGVETLNIQRFAFPARLPPNMTGSVNDRDAMNDYVPKCLNEGYRSRSMVKLWGMLWLSF